jgi:alanine racemase
VSLHEPVLDLDEETRPTRLEIDLDALAENLRRIRGACGSADVLAVLKANAYGHGLVPVARLMESLGVPMVGVAYLEEGIKLRRAGLTLPILVMGGIVGSQIPAFLRHDLTLTASSIDKLEAIEAAAAAAGARARAHLKVDTGMERIGVHWYNARPLLERALRCRHVAIEGIFSHLANADAEDLTSARAQLDRFQQVLAHYDQLGAPRPLAHLANSGAVLQLPEAAFDLVRPGLLLYGVPPAPHLPDLGVRLAARWTTRVVYFKVVLPGSPVSYGGRWVSDAPHRVVTLPVGYGDGYPRRMSGQAEVWLRGARHPVIGTICMDQVMVSVGWGSAYNGDEVVLMGPEVGAPKPTDLAAWAGTLPYEIFTGINTRVPRVYRSADPARLALAAPPSESDPGRIPDPRR